MSLIGTCCPNLYKWRQGNCCRAKERKGGRFLTIESYLRTILFRPNFGIWWFTFLDNRKLPQNNSISAKFRYLMIYLVIQSHWCTIIEISSTNHWWLPQRKRKEGIWSGSWILSLIRIVAEFCHRITLLLNSVIESHCCWILSSKYFVA